MTLTDCIYEIVLNVSTSPYTTYVLPINPPSEPAITCSKLTIETLEQGVKYVQS